MDAAPATPPKEVAAIHAPAPDARAGLGYVSARAGFGVGAGSLGLAGTHFGSAEVWPSYFLGIGVDLSRAGTSELDIGGPPSSASIEAFRGTLSLRLSLRKATKTTKTIPFVKGSVGLGPAVRTTTRGVEVDPDPELNENGEALEDDCLWDCSEYETRRRSSNELGALVQAGVFVRLWKFEVGGGLRLDFAGGTAVMTLGPSAGVEF